MFTLKIEATGQPQHPNQSGPGHTFLVGSEGVYVTSRAEPPRDDRATVIVNDSTVTRGSLGGHCRIWSDSGELFVEDLYSDNGVWLDLDGDLTKVAPRRASSVPPGARVVLGETILVVVSRRLRAS